MKVTGPTLRVVSIGGAGVDTARVMCDCVCVCVCICVLTGKTPRGGECRTEEEDMEGEQVNINAEVWGRRREIRGK